MQCPDCGFMMDAFEEECRRCKKLGKPKPVTSAVPSAPPAASLPPTEVLSQIPPEYLNSAGPPTIIYVQAPSRSSARVGLILGMMALNIVSTGMFYAHIYAAYVIIDICAFVCAFRLVRGQAGADRFFGWLKIIVETGGWILILILLSSGYSIDRLTSSFRASGEY